MSNIQTLTDANKTLETLEQEERLRQEEEAKKIQQEQEAAEKSRQELERQAKAAVKAPSDDAETVYVGATGNKYHKQSCSTLKGKGYAMSLSKAKAQGRTACKRCGG